jgi:hypothetical protein
MNAALKGSSRMDKNLRKLCRQEFLREVVQNVINCANSFIVSRCVYQREGEWTLWT